MASLEFSLKIQDDCVNIEAKGFNDSLPELVSQVLTLIGNFGKSPRLKELFSFAKEKLLMDWHNFYYEQSYRQIGEIFDTLMVSPNFEKK